MQKSKKLSCEQNPYFSRNIQNYFFLQNNPEKSRSLVTCPFNALHLFYPNELEQHMLQCVDAERHTKPAARAPQRKGNIQVPLYTNNHSSLFNPDQDEEWTEEEYMPSCQNTFDNREVKTERDDRFDERNIFLANGSRRGGGRGILCDKRLLSS